MWHALALLATGLLVGPDDAPKDPLVGTWSIVSLIHDGALVAEAKGDTLTFKEGKITIKKSTGEHVGPYQINISRKPANIDLLFGEDPKKGMTMKGLFSVEKDEFKLCLGAPGKDRPTAFESKTGDGAMMVVLKRGAK